MERASGPVPPPHRRPRGTAFASLATLRMLSCSASDGNRKIVYCAVSVRFLYGCTTFDASIARTGRVHGDATVWQQVDGDACTGRFRFGPRETRCASDTRAQVVVRVRRPLSITNDECGLRQDVVKACTLRSSRVFVPAECTSTNTARDERRRRARLLRRRQHHAMLLLALTR
ncbi:hypothetical protein KDW07_05000 [Burkholderia dolosa]|uniref:hypothetical protein n=1 Tax=Burkholderia dolosa TaxID=152500 RepID=UPI001B944441|nr:hypothetical protein [Burkholderia dolosa]MBR8456530.1 hypothetical protein [Burkholderia dolosa]MDN7424347.1 hypothetical protein [Burkholderia dolosa]